MDEKATKAIIIGTSLAGKTTLVRYLRQHTDLPVQEIDEEITKANGGEWPKSIEYKNQVLVPPIKAKVLSQENIIFFTNVFYFTPSDLQTARDRGFKIILIHTSREELEKRNQHRMLHEDYEDQSQWLDSMHQEQQNLQTQKIFDQTIETNKPVDEIAEELITFLHQ